MSRLRPFFPYFGGKWRIAPRYPAPRHTLIVEPFAGAAGYALSHHMHDVLLSDLDQRVVGAWNYLITTPSEEIARLPLYDGTWNTIYDLDISQEAQWLIGWWMNKGAGGISPSKWMRESANLGENYWGPGIRDRLTRQADEIRHWKVLHGSYADLENLEATWFVDPPYQIAGKGYRHHSVDLKHLAEWCREREGQTIVCENMGADWLPFQHFFDAKGAAGATRTGVSKEAVWYGPGGDLI